VPLKAVDESEQLLAEEMLSRVNTENVLAPLCAMGGSLNIRRKTLWAHADTGSLNFPTLTNRHIQQLTFGVYQSRQARKYRANTKALEFSQCIGDVQDNMRLVHTSIPSWHKSKVYNVYVCYRPGQGGAAANPFHEVTGW